MSKLELLYTCCQSVMIHELQQFWKCYDIKPEDIQTDPDQLQAILVFIVSRLEYPQIFTEIMLCE
jgi:hypothetical protein